MAPSTAARAPAADAAAPTSSFSLEEVSARIAQLRAQLRADAESGGGGGGGGSSIAASTTTNAPSSSRFSALVELGSLLATCSLPDYSPPVRRELADVAAAVYWKERNISPKSEARKGKKKKRCSISTTIMRLRRKKPA